MRGALSSTRQEGQSMHHNFFYRKFVMLGILILFFIVMITTLAHASSELDDTLKAIKEKKGKWIAADTAISKLSQDERKNRLGALLPSATGREKKLLIPSASLPIYLDWRNYAGNNYVTPIKDQGTCGICWAFATTAALESNVLISQNTPSVILDLSEQVLTSCANVGTCSGGLIDAASDFIRDNGLPQESCYPYIASDGICSNACSNWLTDSYKITDWYLVDPTVNAIKYAVYNLGPVVTLMAAHTDFFYYSSGIYSHVWGGFQGYHAATIIGYDDAEQYFIVKSSWGTDWGETGYFRVGYSEISADTIFGVWSIVYQSSIPADFPTIEGITRTLNKQNAEDQNNDNNQANGTENQPSGGSAYGHSNSQAGNSSSSTTAKKHRQIAGPGWVMVKSRPITHEQNEADIIADRKNRQTNTTKTPMLAALATSITPEIKELARALHYDLNNINSYMKFNIDFVPYFGSRKGATQTLLDGSGNDFDQAALMVALLRESGYLAQFYFVKVRYSFEVLANLLGVQETWEAISGALWSGGIPCSRYGDEQADVDRMWVLVTINGAYFAYDPAIKLYSYKNKIDIAGSMVYSRNELVAAATVGATFNSIYTQNVNEMSIRDKLAAYSSQLVSVIRNMYPNSDVNEILGGRTILSDVGSTSIGYYWLKDEIPPDLTSKLILRHGDLDYAKDFCRIDNPVFSSVDIDAEYDIPDISGKSLTLMHRSGRPIIMKDEFLSAGGQAATTDKALCIIVDHPGTFADQWATYTIKNNGSYAIVSNFNGVSDALLRKRQQRLDIYVAAGASEYVLGETLNIMGLTWMKETQEAQKLLSSISGVVYATYHRVGLMAQEAGYYIDVKNSLDFTSYNDSDSDKKSFQKALTLIQSSFEHGMLEQLMGSESLPKPAVSTMKLFQLANASGRKVFTTSKSNFESSIQQQLINYSTTDIANIQERINRGYTVILPDNGKLTLNNWTGAGYISHLMTGSTSTYYIEASISPGYNGGYSSTDGTVDTSMVSDRNQTNQQCMPNSDNINLMISPVDTPLSLEPVDMASGAYVYNHTDLNLGSSAPMGLSFTRSYNSGLNRIKRTLGYGWTHNYDIYLTQTSHGDPGLGRRQPVDAASFIAALYVIYDILKSEDNIRGWMIGSLISKWAIDQLIDNAVTVHIGSKVAEFIKLADGTYASPPGVTTKLVRNSDGIFDLHERFGTSMYFNTSHRIREIVDADRNTMAFFYNGGNLVAVRDAFGRILSFGYDPSNEQISSVWDTTGRIVDYYYRSNGDLSQYKDPEQKIWSYDYDTEHRMKSLINPFGIDTARNYYDTIGRVEKQIVPRQGGTTAEYNFYFTGYENSEEDPAGNRITYYFDDKGRNIGEQDALKNKWTKKYDGQDHVIEFNDPKLNKTSYLYDGNHNVTSIISALSYTTTFQYYPDTFLLSDIIDPLLHTTHFEYNSSNHLKLTRDNEGNQFTADYYPNGLKRTATDGRGTTSTFVYNALGDPYTSQTGIHSLITYAYDPFGRMTGLTDQANAQTTFEYDKRGLLKKIIDPSRTISTDLVYYDDGNLWTKTDRNGHTVTYSYTPTGKIETITYPDFSTVTFLYNQLDQLYEMWDSIGTTSYTYFENGRLKSITDPRGFTVGYKYDAAGNVSELTYPDGKKLIYTYDKLNRIKTVKIDWLTKTATYNYKVKELYLENLVGFNGLVTGYTYDTAHRLTGISSTIASYAFSELDGNGNRKTIVQNEPLAPSFVMSDATYTYNDTKNRLLSAGNTSFIYDIEGQLLAGDGVTNEFDYEHRLRRSGSNYYYYDSSGRRLEANRNGVTTRYIYDAAGNVIAEADSSNTITRYYIYGAGLLAMVTPEGEVYSYHYNATGSTTAMTNQSKTIVNKYAYDAFGAVLNQVEAVLQPFKYIGQFGVIAEPNGFYYMRARYYDPNVGRFISEDPLGFGGGDVNLYAYVGNNPVNLIDPNGNVPQALVGAAIGGVTGGVLAYVNDQPVLPGIAMGVGTGALATVTFGASWQQILPVLLQ